MEIFSITSKFPTDDTNNNSNNSSSSSSSSSSSNALAAVVQTAIHIIIIIHCELGMAHNYMLTLKQLAYRRDCYDHTRDVYFYDQSGCGGESILPTGKKNATRYYPNLLDCPFYYLTIELSHIVEYLSLNKYHLIVNSWGAVYIGISAIFCIKCKSKNRLQLLVSSGPLSDGDLYL